MDRARNLWRKAIEDLPMNEMYKKKLKSHWENLHEDFQIK